MRAECDISSASTCTSGLCLDVRRSGLSLLEVLAVVVVVGILAVLALPRSATNSLAAKQNACYALKANLEVQAQLWFRHKATWPAADLSDLAADELYLPEGLPVCPVDGTAYTFDPTTHRVVGHVH